MPARLTFLAHCAPTAGYVAFLLIAVIMNMMLRQYVKAQKEQLRGSTNFVFRISYFEYLLEMS